MIRQVQQREPLGSINLKFHPGVHVLYGLERGGKVHASSRVF